MILKEVFNASIPHIEDLSVKKFIDVLQNLHEYEITEKVDGSQILFGIDEYGFYTSRETKGGGRVYTVEAYPNTFVSSYMRAAHLALESVLPILEESGLSVGDQVEAEVLFGELPNAIPYSPNVNHIIFLRTTEGFVNINKLKTALLNESVSVKLEFPKTSNGKEVVLEEEVSNWVFSSTPKIHVNLATPLKPLIKKLQVSENKEETTKLIEEVKSFLLNQIVRRAGSAFGPPVSEGGWIEGVVLSHPKTRDRCKIVDKEVFTKVRNFLWESRSNLTAIPYHHDDVCSFLGSVLVGLGNSIGHPELGTRQARKYMSHLGETKSEVIEALANKVNFLTIKEYWHNFISTKEVELNKELQKYELSKSSKLLEVNTFNKKMQVSYTTPVDIRTKQVFSELFAKLSFIKETIYHSESIEDLFYILIEGKLNDIDAFKKYIPELSDSLTADNYRAILSKLKTDYSLDKRAVKAKNLVINLWKQGNRVSSSYDLALKDLHISLRDII